MKNSALENDFSRFIKYLRAKYNLSLKDFSALIGFSAAYVSDLQQGFRLPTKNVVGNIINALNLNEMDKRGLYDAAGKALNEIPFDLHRYLIDNEDILKQIIEEMENTKRLSRNKNS